MGAAGAEPLMPTRRDEQILTSVSVSVAGSVLVGLSWFLHITRRELLLHS